MTSIPNRTNSALLVIDVQNSVVADAHQRDQIVANINTAVVKARAADVPVIWIQHSDEWMAIGSDDWKIVPELVPPMKQYHPFPKYGRTFLRDEKHLSPPFFRQSQ